MPPLLELRDLRTYFYHDSQASRAVDGVSFKVDRMETLGIVGESGCGKSVCALSILRLVTDPPGKIVGGEVLLEGIDVLKLSEEDMRKIRGNRIAMVFQEPMTRLNPLLSCGTQIQEAIVLHHRLSRKDARDRAVSLLRLVGIPAAERRIKDYPHQLSGGMRQRVMIAAAISCSPEVLIADEPTTALDVTVQAQILELMTRLQDELRMGMIIITHNLGILAQVADRLAVMYAGKIIEHAASNVVFNDPLHPYTIGLLQSIPQRQKKRSRLKPIRGIVPAAAQYPRGCRFAPRCPLADEHCQVEDPPMREVAPEHGSACWMATDSRRLRD